MATTTFYKRITIDNEAADKLITILSKPAPPRSDVSGKFRMMTEDDIKCCLQNRSAHLFKRDSQKR